MDWKRLADQAKQVINKRGGTESVKEDVEELRDIAHGPGTLSEKAKQAAEAIKEPGSHHEQGGSGGHGDDPSQESPRDDVEQEPAGGQAAEEPAGGQAAEEPAGGQGGGSEDH